MKSTHRGARIARGAILAILAAGAGAGLSVPAAAQLVVQIAPPAPRIEVVPAPRGGYVWAPGYWRWGGRHYHWVPGHWVRQHRGNYYYGPGHWEQGPNGWVFVRPGWHPGPPPPGYNPPPGPPR